MKKFTIGDRIGSSGSGSARDKEISRNQSKRDDRDHHPHSTMKSGDALRGNAGEPMTATKIATPTASDACRIMLITPEPVANEDGGSPDALTPIKVGKVNPTPIPIGIMPMTTSVALGSSPITPAQQIRPAAKKRMPAVMTGAAPKRAISLPASNSEVIGTRSGPGAIARPVLSADHPHAVCSQSATDSRVAPKAAE